MRILIYNISYGIGNPGATHKRILKLHHYLKADGGHFKKIADFVCRSKADIIGLVEADTGSMRTSYINQVETLAEKLNHHHISSVKYGINSPGRNLPILKNQVNALLSSKKCLSAKFHYLPRGFKKLIIEADIAGLKVFLVHLSLRKWIRKSQFKFLADLLPAKEPFVIAGDFNTLSGVEELDELCAELSLSNPNCDSIPTYPSWEPKKQLDFILCSSRIKIKNFQVPNFLYSDHLPLILDFEIRPNPSLHSQ